MTLEVFMPNGKRIIKMPYDKCGYTDHDFETMVKGGYAVKVDGRKWKRGCAK